MMDEGCCAGPHRLDFGNSLWFSEVKNKAQDLAIFEFDSESCRDLWEVASERSEGNVYVEEVYA